MGKGKLTKPDETPKRSSFWARLGTGKERDYFIENLTMMLASGMDVFYALDGIKKEIRSRALRTAIAEMEEDIGSGSSLWRALSNTKLLPDHVVALVRIGEESGRLPQNLKVIVMQQEKDRTFKSKIRSAMIYPILVLFLTLTIGLGIGWFILPRLAAVFSELRMELPLVTKILIRTGNFLGDYGIVAVPFILVSVFSVIYFIFVFPKTKVVGEKILFAFPVVKKLIQEVELSRMGFILGTLLDAGMPVVAALDSLYKASNLHIYKRLYAHLRDTVEEGNSLKNSFTLYPKEINRLIPITVQQMLVAGEKSGQLPQTLVKIGETFETKTETTTKNLTVILEPILLVIVWFGVVGVALAVILPIYSLIGGLNNPTQTSSPPLESAGSQANPDSNGVNPSTPPLPPAPTTTDEVLKSYLEILDTPTGYLNVREQGSQSSPVVARVTPGEQFEFLRLENNWYEIALPEGKTGWVTEKYVKIISN